MNNRLLQIIPQIEKTRQPFPRQHSSSVLIIIPAYNEKKAIKRVIEEVSLFSCLADILIVDDGSVDGTSRQVLTTDADLLRLPCNLGIGAALQVALRYADDLGYAYTLRLDGDGQHNAEDAFRLLCAVMKGEADAAIGSRFLGVRWLGKGRNYQATVSRSIGIKVFSKTVSLLVGQPITDPTSGLRCYNRQVIRYLARYHPQDYPEVESVVMLHRAGFRLLELPATISPRIAGTTSINTPKAIYYVFRVLLATLIAAVRKPHPKIVEEIGVS